MDRFLPYRDELADTIDQRAGELYRKLQKLDVEALGLPYHCLHYYKSSHSNRLFFSIETSAHLLYRGLKMTGKRPDEAIVMDYGAGVGTLYLLARMIECKQVVYNDHLEDWKKSAQLIAEAIDIHIDHYIVGDIGDCLSRLGGFNLRCDLITSRNVIEHIYKLDVFYATIHQQQPEAIVFSSTTANISNPAAVIKHLRWHRKWEKVYAGMRQVVIERLAPGLTATKMKRLVRSTRGLAAADLQEAVETYRQSGQLPDPRVHASNTCEPSNGVWAEHLLNQETYRKLINEAQFKISFSPGFWDTHYPSAAMNRLGKILNHIIKKGGKTAMRLAPFIYVITTPLAYDAVPVSAAGLTHGSGPSHGGNFASGAIQASPNTE